MCFGFKKGKKEGKNEKKRGEKVKGNKQEKTFMSDFVN